jgi:hypothetical protein
MPKNLVSFVNPVSDLVQPGKTRKYYLTLHLSCILVLLLAYSFSFLSTIVTYLSLPIVS